MTPVSRPMMSGRPAKRRRVRALRLHAPGQLRLRTAQARQDARHAQANEQHERARNGKGHALNVWRVGDDRAERAAERADRRVRHDAPAIVRSRGDEPALAAAGHAARIRRLREQNAAAHADAVRAREQADEKHETERGIVRERRDFHEREQLRQPPVEHAHERKTDPIDHHAAHAVRARRIAGIREHLPQRVLRDDVRIIRDRHAAAPVVRLCGDDAARVQQRIRDGVLARPADHAGHIQLQNRGRHGRSLFVSFPRSAHSSTPPDAPHASTAAAAGPITPHAASGRHTA